MSGVPGIDARWHASVPTARRVRKHASEGVCSPRETVDSGLCFMVIKVILRGFFMFFEGKGGKWFRDGGGGWGSRTAFRRSRNDTGN